MARYRPQTLLFKIISFSPSIPIQNYLEGVKGMFEKARIEVSDHSHIAMESKGDYEDLKCVIDQEKTSPKGECNKYLTYIKSRLKEACQRQN